MADDRHSSDGLLERLRGLADQLAHPLRFGRVEDADTCREAAEEIEQLRGGATATDWFKALCEQAEALGERLNQEHGDYTAYSSIMDTIHEAEAELEQLQREPDRIRRLAREEREAHRKELADVRRGVCEALAEEFERLAGASSSEKGSWSDAADLCRQKAAATQPQGATR